MELQEVENDDRQVQSIVRGAVFFVEIPENERLLGSEPTRAEQIHDFTRVKDGVIPDLKGRSVEEVGREAARIKMGQYFTSWNDFNRCMDSWAVLNGRGVARYASKKRYALRVCKYGKTNRKNCKKRRSSGNEADDEHEADREIVHGLEGENLPFVTQDGNFTLELARASMDTENQPVRTSNIATQTYVASSQRVGQTTATTIRVGMPTGSRRGEIAQQTARQTDCRRPLGVLNPNLQIVGRQQIGVRDVARNTARSDASQGVVQRQNQTLQRQTIIRNTRNWLLRRNTQLHGKRVCEKGACGELSRIIPRDEDENDSTEESQPCPFRVRAQVKITTGKIFITICDLTHTCAQLGHKWRAPAHKAFWIGQTIAPRITVNPKVRVKQLQTGFTMEYHKSTNYQQMWRAKDKVRDWYFGGQRASFHRIPAFLLRLTEVDPGCIVNWCTEEDSSTFKRAFICPSAMRGALQYVQPMVYLDATHTKNRKFPTQLFLATALDGNSRIVILCYAVANVESTDNWTWFLQHMHRALHGVDRPSIPFMSDRQKGLHTAVRDVFPGKIHAHCCNHLRANVKSNFGKAAEAFFVGCVYANTKTLFDALLADLQKGASKGVAAMRYIRNIDPSLWARHAVEFPRLGKVSSNPAEQANSGLLPIREYAPFKLLVELWYYMQVKQNSRRTEVTRSHGIFTEIAQRRHDENLKNFGQWQVHDDGAQTAILKNAHNDEEMVKLGPKPRCTCWELQDMIWPCEHIMAWDDRDGRNYRRHFHKCWRTSSLKALYAPTLPCFLTNGLSLSPECFPPEIAVKRGRHRVVRMQSGRGPRRQQPSEGEHWEYDAQGNILIRYPIQDDPNLLDPMPLPNTGADIPQPESRQRRSVSTVGKVRRKCTRCGVVGHNKRTCQLSSNGDVHVEEGTEFTGQNLEEEMMLTGGEPLPTPMQTNEGEVPDYGDSTENEGESQTVSLVHTEWTAIGAAMYGTGVGEADYWLSLAASLDDNLHTHIEEATQNAATHLRI